MHMCDRLYISIINATIILIVKSRGIEIKRLEEGTFPALDNW